MLFSSCGGNRTNFNKQKYTSLKEIKIETDDSDTEENKQYQYFDSDEDESDIDLFVPHQVENENLISFSYSQPEKDHFVLEDISAQKTIEFENRPVNEENYESKFVTYTTSRKTATKKKIDTGGRITLLFLALILTAILTALACSLTFYATTSVGAVIFVGLLGLLAGVLIFYQIIKQTKKWDAEKRRKFWMTLGISAGVLLAISAIFIDWAYLF